MSQPNRKGNKPTRIGRYEVLRKIATGGMAELFLAKKMGMDGFEKVVAIKQILSHLSHEEEFVNMFRDEARIVAKLSHPNIVQIFDLGKSEDSYFIAMEYIPGRNLSSVAKRAKAKNMALEPVYVARSMAQACEGLYYAHNRKEPDGKPLRIVHRDVSPQNIILAFSGQIKIVDFGIAKAATKIAHTRHGVLKGKYAYMSPEQIRGEKIDARSDIFAVGVVLYELLCGRRPFEKENSIQTLKAIVQEPHEDPGKLNNQLAPDLVDIINRCLVKKRDNRYQTAQEVQIALEDYVAASGIRSSNLAISQWLNDMFAEDLQKAKGSTISFKGVGEVILPEEDSAGGSSRSKATETPRPRSGSKLVAPSVRRAAETRNATPSVSLPSSPPPPAAPEELPRGRGGGSLSPRPPIQAPSTMPRPERRPSTQGQARANLIQEGVISGSPNKLPPLPEAYSDDATALAPEFSAPSSDDSLIEDESPTILPDPPKNVPPEPPAERNYSEGTRDGIAEAANESGYDDGATEFGPTFMEHSDVGTAEELLSHREPSSSVAVDLGSEDIPAEESAEEIAARITDARASRDETKPHPLADVGTEEAEFEEIHVSSESSLDALGALPDPASIDDPFAEPSLPRPEMANVDVDADSRTMATADYEAFEAQLAAEAKAKKLAEAQTPRVELPPIPEEQDPFEEQLNQVSQELRRSASEASLSRPVEVEETDDFDLEDEDDTTAMPALKKTPPSPSEDVAALPGSQAPLRDISSTLGSRNNSWGENSDTLPPGTPGSEQLIPPAESEPKSAHPNAGIGSVQVPPANVSLSEMLCEPSSPPAPALAPVTLRSTNDSAGMPSPQMGDNALGDLDALPSPEPLNINPEGGAPMPRSASIARASMARSIREKGRADSNERELQPNQVQLVSPETPNPSARRHTHRMAGAGSGLQPNPGHSGGPENPSSGVGSKIARIVKGLVLTMIFIAAAVGVTFALLKFRVPTLTIETTPPGARVFMDGKLLDGSTPLDTPVNPGQKYRIRIINEGYDEAIRNITVPDSIFPRAVKIPLVKSSKSESKPAATP